MGVDVGGWWWVAKTEILKTFMKFSVLEIQHLCVLFRLQTGGFVYYFNYIKV